MRLARALALYPAALVALLLGTALAPPHAGPLALAQILLPHACLAALALVPLVIVKRDRWLVMTLAALALGSTVRFGPEWLSVPAEGGEGLRVATWNLGRRGAESVDTVIDALLAERPDVVALQELRPALALALERDPRARAAWPHRVLAPDKNALGIGLLSVHEVATSEALVDPVGVEARLTPEDGGALAVIVAHPFPGRLRTVAGVPVTYDAAPRDAAIARLRARIDARLAEGPVLVLGDFNVAPTEPGYALLSAGLHDAHTDAGMGPGWTWRPLPLAPLGVGLLRIDYVLTTLRPVAARVACQDVGDHCLVAATLR